MRGKSNSYSRKAILLFIIIFIIFAVFMVMLGTLRFKLSKMAYRLNGINESIRRCSEEETFLRQELSALTAPIKVYSYCRDQLGMTKMLTADAMPVRARGRAASEKDAEQSGWQGRLARLFGSSER